MLFIADGRFHLESAMISNPLLPAYRYDPYSKSLTLEKYAHSKMLRLRSTAVRSALTAKTVGIVLGTLGRQGNPSILRKVKEKLTSIGVRSFVVLMSEITPDKLDRMPQAMAWVQIACPRLSVDWGHAFTKPILSPYELHCMIDRGGRVGDGGYRMDFYEKGEENYWSNFGTDNHKREY